MTGVDLGELAQDIRALSPSVGSGDLQADRWLTQPAIARRIASAIAATIPAGTERIVASGDSADLLGMAVALACGLPVAIVTPDDRVLGDRHPGEAIYSVALTDAVVDGVGARSTIDLVLIGALGAGNAVFRRGPQGLVPDPTDHPTSEEN